MGDFFFLFLFDLGKNHFYFTIRLHIIDSLFLSVLSENDGSTYLYYGFRFGPSRSKPKTRYEVIKTIARTIDWTNNASFLREKNLRVYTRANSLRRWRLIYAPANELKRLVNTSDLSLLLIFFFFCFLTFKGHISRSCQRFTPM